MAINVGLVRAANVADILAEEERERQKNQPEQEMFVSSLAAHFRKEWEKNRNHKLTTVQERLLNCLRAKLGKYSPAQLAAIQQQGGSDIYAKITTTKIRAAAAWIRDILLPADDKAWAVRPTEIPELPQKIMQLIMQNVMMKMQEMASQGEQIPQGMMEELKLKMAEEVKQEAKQRAHKISDAMEAKILDILQEGGWVNAVIEYIDDFTTYPVAYIKAPIVQRKPVLQWGPDFTPQVGSELAYNFKRVSPFDAYPAPNAKSAQDGTFIEHIRFTRSELHSMLGAPGYKDEAIRSVLEDYGRDGLREWIWDNSERRQLEGGSDVWSFADCSGEIDGLHCWGSAQGRDLIEWGMDESMIEDPLKSYEVEAILIGKEVIRCRINNDPFHRRPYFAASYQSSPDSIYGDAIPELMEDIQRMCNAAARALANNLGIASGPQVEVAVERLAPGEDATAIYPWRVWQTQENAFAGSAPAVRFFQPESNAQELMAVFREYEMKADDATNIPRYIYGNDKVGGAGSTMGGLSMLMDSAAKGIRSAIANIDKHVIEPAISLLWYKLMIYDPDPTIKGDIKVVARGSTALMEKMAAKQVMHELLALTNNPTDMSIIQKLGRAKMLQEVFSNANMQHILPDMDDIKKQIIAESQNPPIDPQIERAQIEDARKREELAVHSDIEREKIDASLAIAEMKSGEKRAQDR